MIKERQKRKWPPNKTHYLMNRFPVEQEELFHELIDYCTSLMNKEEVEVKKNYYFKELKKEINKINKKFQVKFLTDKEDVSQEFLIQWLRFFKVYEDKNLKCNLKTYMLKRTLWFVKYWYKQQAQFIISDYEYSYKEDKIYTDFRIDINFLIHGSIMYPFSMLNSYERFLLFLKFNHDKSISEISDILQRNREQIALEYKYLIRKLKKLYSEV